MEETRLGKNYLSSLSHIPVLLKLQPLHKAKGPELGSGVL